MRRPLLSHKNSHIVFREKGGSRSSPTHFRNCALHPPHTGHLQFLQTGISASRPWSQPLYVHTRGGAWAAASSRGWKGKGPFGHRKKQKLTLKVTLQGLCQHAEAANVRKPITQVTPLIAIGTCLCGLCPFRIMPPSLRIFLVLALHLVLPFSDFGHSTTETASNCQVAVGVSLQVTRTQKLKDPDWRIPAPATTN